MLYPQGDTCLPSTFCLEIYVLHQVLYSITKLKLGQMELRCVQCGHKVAKLYVQYSPGNIRLVKCGNCKEVADEYIECELMILIIDLILHKLKAYRHLLFNMLSQERRDMDGLLLKSSLMFLILDACKITILMKPSHEWSSSRMFFNILVYALFGNMVFFYVLVSFSRKFLHLVDAFCGIKDILLAVLVSSYLKVYMAAMMVWEFPFSLVYIIELFVMSSNLVALRAITESSTRKCMGVCCSAFMAKFFLCWMLNLYK